MDLCYSGGGQGDSGDQNREELMLPRKGGENKLSLKAVEDLPAEIVAAVYSSRGRSLIKGRKLESMATFSHKAKKE